MDDGFWEVEGDVTPVISLTGDIDLSGKRPSSASLELNGVPLVHIVQQLSARVEELERRLAGLS